MDEELIFIKLGEANQNENFFVNIGRILSEKKGVYKVSGFYALKRPTYARRIGFVRGNGMCMRGKASSMLN